MVDRLRISRRMLVIFLLASVAAHALLLVFVPGWRVSVPVSAPEMPMLDVVMVAAQLPAAPPPAKTAAPAPNPRVASPPLLHKAAPVIAQDAAVPPVVLAPEPASSVASTPAPSSVEPSSPPAATVSAPPAAITPPAFSAAYLRNPPPAYPASARRNGEEGTVMLRVLVGRDGVPLKVEVGQSSRSRLLDQAAQDAVQGWRFVPARRGTETIEAWVRVPVSFRLES